MRNTQRTVAMIGIFLVAVLLAFPLRDSVYALVIVPISYVLWVLGLIYHSVDQVLWWIVLLVAVLAIISRSLLPKVRLVERQTLKTKPIVGKVENLSLWIKKTRRGTYFKWLVANRLGKIAHQILAQRMSGKPRSFFDPLTGPDWMPDAAVQSYLEAGLHGSFADYPQKKKYFSQPVSTPMDHDMSEVIKYLESQIDNQSG